MSEQVHFTLRCQPQLVAAAAAAQKEKDQAAHNQHQQQQPVSAAARAAGGGRALTSGGGAKGATDLSGSAAVSEKALELSTSEISAIAIWGAQL